MSLAHWPAYIFFLPSRLFFFFSSISFHGERHGAIETPPRSLLNGSDLLTPCLDMSRFFFSLFFTWLKNFLSLYNNIREIKHQRKEKGRGRPPDWRRMDCHPRFVYSLFFKKKKKGHSRENKSLSRKENEKKKKSFSSFS